MFFKDINVLYLETKCFKLTCLSEYFLLKMTNILDFQLNECLQIFNIKAMFHNWKYTFIWVLQLYEYLQILNALFHNIYLWRRLVDFWLRAP